MRFTHRTVGPRKGTGTIDIGTINPSKKKRKKRKIEIEIKEEMKVTFKDIIKNEKRT